MGRQGGRWTQERMQGRMDSRHKHTVKPQKYRKEQKVSKRTRRAGRVTCGQQGETLGKDGEQNWKKKGGESKKETWHGQPNFDLH